MNHAKRWIVLAGLLMLFASPGVTQARDAKPVKMSEVTKLIDEGKGPKAVLKLMAERGVGFKLSSLAERRLKKLGFSSRQIDLVRRIAKGEKVELEDKPAQEDDGDPKDAGPGADPPAEQPGAKAGYPVGYAYSDAQHKAERKRIERAIKAAGLDFKRVSLGRITLYCRASRAKSLAKTLGALEAALIKRFPKRIVNSISPESSHIVIVDGGSEWQRWVDACFSSYEMDGIKFRFGPGDEDPRKSFGKFATYFLRDMLAINASKQGGEERISRLACYAVGHLMMRKAAGPKQPDGLWTGFGNYTEAMAHRTPSVMMFTYEQRKLEQEDAWRRLVHGLMKRGEIKNPHHPWFYKTDSMKPQHYAECWSLVSTLAADPAKFDKLIGAIRTGQGKVSDHIKKIYGLTDRQLLEAWFRFVSQ